MNWYKKAQSKTYKLAYVDGEFWIDESGNATFADGDIGDSNHSFFVMQRIISNYFTEGINEPDLYQIMNMPDAELLREGMSVEEINVIRDKTDPRMYAMKNWGWIRITDKYVQTWTLTPATMKNIANGLFEAFNEDAFKELFEIEILSNNQIYSNVPYSVIETENPMELRNYGNMLI